MKITIETLPNPNKNAVEEGLPELLRMTIAGEKDDGTPYESVQLDKPICCSDCGVAEAAQHLMALHMRANIGPMLAQLFGELEKADGDGKESEEWKDGDK